MFAWLCIEFGSTKLYFAFPFSDELGKALTSDWAAGYSVGGKDEGKRPLASPSHSSAKAKTFFGQQFGIAIIDEGHIARKTNKTYYAFRVLQSICSALVVMTATPIINSPLVHSSYYDWTDLTINYQGSLAHWSVYGN